jgi:hypothetical protein
MSILRHDDRQWLIYKKGPVSAVLRGLETLALGIVGRSLAQNGVVQVRAIGNVMMKISDTRLRYMLGMLGDVPDEDRAVGEALVKISAWLSTGSGEPTEALDEFHAAVYALDSKLNNAGVNGDGWFRDLAKGI